MSNSENQKPPAGNRPSGTIINENFTKNTGNESQTKKDEK